MIQAWGGGQLRLGGTSLANVQSSIRLLTGSTKIGWLIGAQYNLHNTLEITPATTAGGTTFSTPVIAFNKTNTAGSPLWQINGDSNTGIYHPAPDTIAMSTGGAERFLLTNEGNAVFSGSVTGGSIQATYQDLAEWVPSSQNLKRGTVVVLDSERRNQVVASQEAYDISVAGVISEQPGLLLGEGGAGKVMVATTGRVRVRADDSGGAIQIGDLLVTSGRSGTAMKSEPMEIGGRKFHQPGTIIGKALEPLESHEGEILVLLSLQ